MSKESTTEAASTANDAEFAADEFEAPPPGQLPEEADPEEAAVELEGTSRERANQHGGQTAKDIIPEDEGFPETIQDNSPTQEMAEDPQFEPLPGEYPVASTDWGTTAFEQAEGESLSGRLDREIPEEIPDIRTAEDPDRAPGQFLYGGDTGPYDDPESDAVTDTAGAAERESAGGEGPEERAMHVFEA